MFENNGSILSVFPCSMQGAFTVTESFQAAALDYVK